MAHNEHKCSHTRRHARIIHAQAPFIHLLACLWKMCVRAYMRMWVGMCVCASSVYMCACVRVYECVYAAMCVSVSVWICMWMCACARVLFMRYFCPKNYLLNYNHIFALHLKKIKGLQVLKQALERKNNQVLDKKLKTWTINLNIRYTLNHGL